MGHCKDCKHWGETRRERSYHPDGTRGPIVEVVQDTGFDWKPCQLIGRANWFLPDTNLGNGAVMHNEDSQGACDLLTGPDFGCSLFEAK